MEAYKTVGSNMTLSNMFGLVSAWPILSSVPPSPLSRPHTLPSSTHIPLPSPTLTLPLHLNFFPHYSPFPLLVFILTMTLFNHLPWVLTSPWSWSLLLSEQSQVERQSHGQQLSVSSPVAALSPGCPQSLFLTLGSEDVCLLFKVTRFQQLEKKDMAIFF